MWLSCARIRGAGRLQSLLIPLPLKSVAAGEIQKMFREAEWLRGAAFIRTVMIVGQSGVISTCNERWCLQPRGRALLQTTLIGLMRCCIACNGRLAPPAMIEDHGHALNVGWELSSRRQPSRPRPGLSET